MPGISLGMMRLYVRQPGLTRGSFSGMSGSVCPSLLSEASSEIDPPFDVVWPKRALAAPIIVASPHSGRTYPASFLESARLDPVTLRHSEDAFVDEICASAPEIGLPLLKANFPRAYVDPNREPYELDPGMFQEPLPAFVNTTSTRVAGGLGTIARVVTDGAEIYAGKLTFREARERIDTYYWPYHQAQQALIEQVQAQFGCALLIDCHSMPSIGGPMDLDSGRSRADIVLGDRYGSACSPAVSIRISAQFREFGYSVVRNNPYAGGYTTGRYGLPARGVHAIQIEIKRSLYMNEKRVERGPGLSRLRSHMKRLLRDLTQFDFRQLEPSR